MPAIICPKCRYLNREGSAVCNLCSGPLKGVAPDAAAGAADRTRPPRPAPAPPAAPAPPPLPGALGAARVPSPFAGPRGGERCHFIVCPPFPPLRLHPSFSYTIGRERDNNVCLPAKIVSRYHAVVRQKDGAWAIADQRSANGTFVNDKAVRETSLKDRDRIKIGTFELMFREVSSAEMHPSALEVKDRESETLLIDQELLRKLGRA